MHLRRPGWALMRREEWQTAMRTANQLFGLSPHAFWRMSVAEWRALVARTDAGAAPTRAELDAMMAKSEGRAE